MSFRFVVSILWCTCFVSFRHEYNFYHLVGKNFSQICSVHSYSVSVKNCFVKIDYSRFWACEGFVLVLFMSLLTTMHEVQAKNSMHKEIFATEE